MNIYSASDYAGMDTAKYSFYYGYEETDENDNWYFVAIENNSSRKKYRISITDSDVNDRFDCQECLLYGIGKFLDAEITSR